MPPRPSASGFVVRVRPLVPALALASFLALAAFLAPPLARAQAAPADDVAIEYRQYLMSAVGFNMGAIGTILKNQLPLPGAVANHAHQLADSAKLIAPAFRQKASAGKTDAKPEIWSDWAKFEAAIADFEKAANGLATAAQGSDGAAIGAAVRALGDSCTGCHDPFRKPKEQSYKNR